MLIYQMTHIPTGKIYLGSLKNSARWLTYNTSSKIVRNMISDSPTEWQRQILMTFDDWITCVKYEQLLISNLVKKYGWSMLWNRSVFGPGLVYSPEALEKKRKSLTGRQLSAEDKEKKRQAALRRYQDPDQRAKTGAAISSAKKGKTLSQSHRDAISAGNKSNSNLSNIRRQKWQDPEYRARTLSAQQAGRLRKSINNKLPYKD